MFVVCPELGQLERELPGRLLAALPLQGEGTSLSPDTSDRDWEPATAYKPSCCKNQKEGQQARSGNKCARKPRNVYKHTAKGIT
eukprot:scaffold208300_cov18-Tisochrysis_lutea.AAC.1